MEGRICRPTIRHILLAIGEAAENSPGAAICMSEGFAERVMPWREQKTAEVGDCGCGLQKPRFAG